MKNIEKYSLGYALLKWVAHIPFRLTHKSYIVNGVENIPKNRPVIYAPNHQNALLDALAILFSSPIQPVFLARADIFKNKLVSKILYFLKILPVYRIRDGKKTLTKNEEVFDDAIRILKNNKALCLFPEAAHVGIKSMLPHKKAIPRIVFLGAEKTNFNLDTQLVPVGINYSNYYGFRRNVTINFGKPLHAKDYCSIFKEEGENKATIKLRNDLFEAVRQLVVHVPQKETYVLFEEAFVMASFLTSRSVFGKSKDFVPHEQYITKKIDQYLQQHTEEKQKWIDTATQYQQLKKKLKLTENAIESNQISFPKIQKNTLLLTIGLPFSIWGTIANGWLFYLTRYPYRKSIKDPQFHSSISYVLSLLFFPIWILVEYFILYKIFHSGWIALGLILLSIPGGIMAWESGQLLMRFFNRLKYNQLSKKKNPDYEQLISLRKDLLNFYNACTKQ